MYSTKYVKPNTTSEALEAIKSLSDGKFLAGGMTLIPTLKQRLASPDGLVDISGCKLESISDEGETIKIGAMSRHVNVADSAVVKKAIPALASLAEGIGDGEGGVFRHEEMETALSGNYSPDALSSLNIASDGLISDLHASAEYRANLIKEMTKRAVV